MRSWTSPAVPRLDLDPAMGVGIHDTATGAVTVTAPSGPARMYVCGITPYDATHVGHAATYVAFDLLNRAWRDADVLLLPTVPTTFTRAQLAEEPVARNLVLGRYTQFANLLDLAALAYPAGLVEGLPFGVQLVAPAFTDHQLIDLVRNRA